MAAEVDAGPSDRGHAGGRDILERQHGITLAGPLVGSSRHHAVTVRVLQMGGDPSADKGAELVGIDLARGEQQLQILGADLVAINRHLVLIELVVAAKALQVFQGGRQRQLRIPKPGVLNGLRISCHRVRGERVRRREWPILDARQSIGLARKFDLVLDVRRLPGELAGGDLEALDEAGKHHQQDEGGAQPGDHRHGKRRELAAEAVDEQSGRDQQHQHRHDPVGRNARRDVRITDAADESALAQ